MSLRDALASATGQRLARRLYLLAVASVMVAIGTVLVVARLGDPPPEPRFIGYLLSRVADALDDDTARAREVKRLFDETGDTVAVYRRDGALFAATAAPALPALTADERRALDEGRVFRREDRAFVARVRSPSGESFDAVIQLASKADRNRNIGLLIGAVLFALMIVALVSGTMLAAPLSELARATQAFGQGDLTARACPKKAGAFADLASVFNDMADRLTASIRAEKEMLANVSHELRTPLSRIKVALELAEEAPGGNALEPLKDIAADLGELETLVEDVLTAARLDGRLGRTGAPPVRVEPTAPAVIVERAAQRFRAAWPDRPLRVFIDEPLPVISVDRVLLRRALDNVLDNAGKYSEPGAAVLLSVRAEEGVVEVDVTDHGVGIAVDDQAQLFTPFFRADRSRTRSKGGVGLGLVLARRIVEAHGGKVVVDSELGAGTTVRLSLPVDAAAGLSPLEDGPRLG